MKYGFLVLTSLMAGLCNPVVEDTSDTRDTTSELPAACADGGTITEVQTGVYADGDEITVGCAVVTSELTSTGGGFFVQDPGGGAWSGIYVYLYSSVEVDDIDLHVGDLVTIAGSVSEYYDLTEISLSTAYDIAVIGEWDVTTDPVDCDESDWEQWEGCLISVDGVEMTGNKDYYNETTTGCEFSLDDLLYDYDGGAGSSCASITGAFTYAYEAWKLCPRSGADLVDCSEPDPVEPTTIANIRQDGYAEGDIVRLEGVVATTEVASDLFFIQDQGGGEYTGLTVYLGTEDFDAEPGMILDIEGELDDYYDLLELKPSTLEDTGSSTDTVATALDATPADWESWEGALISLADVAITSDANEYGEYSTNFGIVIDDLFYLHGFDNGSTYSSVTGVLTYSYEEWKLEVRGAGDVTE